MKAYPRDIDISSRESKNHADEPGYLMWHVTNLWQRKLRARMKTVNLTHVQFALLSGIHWLSIEDVPVTQVRLAEYTSMDTMMTSDVLHTLEAKGYVERFNNPTDKRSKVLKLSPQGSEILVKATQIALETNDSFFKLPKERTDVLLEILRQIIENNEKSS